MKILIYDLQKFIDHDIEKVTARYTAAVDKKQQLQEAYDNSPWIVRLFTSPYDSDYLSMEFRACAVRRMQQTKTLQVLNYSTEFGDTVDSQDLPKEIVDRFFTWYSNK